MAEAEQRVVIHLPATRASALIYDIKCDTSMFYKDRAEHAVDCTNLMELVTRLYPVVVTDDIVGEVILPEPRISAEDFRKCGFPKELEKIDGIRKAWTVASDGEKRYCRLVIYTTSDDIEATYLTLLHILL